MNRIATNPTTGTCPMCELEFAGRRLIKRHGEWVHRDCWAAEKGQ